MYVAAAVITAINEELLMVRLQQQRTFASYSLERVEIVLNLNYISN